MKRRVLIVPPGGGDGAIACAGAAEGNCARVGAVAEWSAKARDTIPFAVVAYMIEIGIIGTSPQAVTSQDSTR